MNTFYEFFAGGDGAGRPSNRMDLSICQRLRSEKGPYTPFILSCHTDQ